MQDADSSVAVVQLLVDVGPFIHEKLYAGGRLGLHGEPQRGVQSVRIKVGSALKQHGHGVNVSISGSEAQSRSPSEDVVDRTA